MPRGTFLIRRTSIPGVEAVEAETDHVFPKHTHEQFGIGVIRWGAQASLSGRGVVNAGPGDVITVNPGEVHDGMPIGEQGRMWKMLYFDPAVIVRAVDDIRIGTRDHELRHPVLSDREAAGNFIRLYALVTGARPWSALAGESLLLSLMNRLISERNAAPAADLPWALRHVRSAIDDEPMRDFELADLARIGGLSRFQVLRGFARMTGLTPHAYLMQKRADLARRLIKGGQPLADVAAASGFADQSHMTRIFTGKYGVTPGAYAAAVG